MQASISQGLPYGRIGGGPRVTAVPGRAASARRAAVTSGRRGVRLTRRGRRVIGALLAALLAGVLALLLGVGPAVNAAPESGGSVEIVVERGDTLWSVARRHDPAQDPLVTVEEIRKLNDLPGYTVHPGQRLKLP
jgi:LysM repeat protein